MLPGASEAILTILALRDGLIPPTLNLKNLDPEIDLDVVAGGPRPGNYEYAVNNSFGSDTTRPPPTISDSSAPTPPPPP